MKSISVKSRNGDSRTLRAEVIQNLRNALEGDVLREEDAGYYAARRIWNGMVDKHPGMIVQCAGTADVVQAVNFAREQDLLASIRGGGHNVAGSAIADKGVVIDLSRMRGVQADPEHRSVRAEGGAKLGDLDAATAPFGLLLPLGLSRPPVLPA
jgi:FAD/FMN-containing dehydrogenase